MSLENQESTTRELVIVSNVPASARFCSVDGAIEVDHGRRVDDGTKILAAIARHIEPIARAQRPTFKWPRGALSARLRQPDSWRAVLRIPNSVTGPELREIAWTFGTAIMVAGCTSGTRPGGDCLMTQAAIDAAAASALKFLQSPVSRKGPLPAHVDCSLVDAGIEILRLKGSVRPRPERGDLKPHDDSMLGKLEGYSEAEHWISVHENGDVTKNPQKIFCEDDVVLQDVVDRARAAGMLRYAYTRTMPNDKQHLSLRYAERP
jgi:hypothetical protein